MTRYVKLSNFYWAVSIIISFILMDIHYSADKNIVFLFLSIFVFLIALLIGHNKTIQNKLNGER